MVENTESNETQVKLRSVPKIIMIFIKRTAQTGKISSFVKESAFPKTNSVPIWAFFVIKTRSTRLKENNSEKTKAVLLSSETLKVFRTK